MIYIFNYIFVEKCSIYIFVVGWLFIADGMMLLKFDCINFHCCVYVLFFLISDIFFVFFRLLFISALQMVGGHAAAVLILDDNWRTPIDLTVRSWSITIATYFSYVFCFSVFCWFNQISLINSSFVFQVGNNIEMREDGRRGQNIGFVELADVYIWLLMYWW